MTFLSVCIALIFYLFVILVVSLYIRMLVCLLAKAHSIGGVRGWEWLDSKGGAKKRLCTGHRTRGGVTAISAHWGCG